jgi:hypothetical protein
MEAATDIDYDRIGRLLESSALAPTPGEAHGILCGLICGGDPDPRRSWLDQLLPTCSPGGDASDLLVGEACVGLGALAECTWDQIHGPGLGFSLLLPDDSRPLAERATALYDWVRGFLYALGLLGVSERDLSEQTREIFRDFSDLTRMDLNALGEGEENEDALTEIAEFVWVAAMLVYEERVAAPQERQAKRS